MQVNLSGQPAPWEGADEVLAEPDKSKCIDRTYRIALRLSRPSKDLAVNFHLRRSTADIGPKQRSAEEEKGVNTGIAILEVIAGGICAFVGFPTVCIPCAGYIPFCWCLPLAAVFCNDAIKRFEDDFDE